MLEDWEGFRARNAKLLDNAGIPTGYLEHEGRFQDMLALGYSRIDWSDWDVSLADAKALMRLIEGYVEAGGQNEFLRFLGEGRAAMLEQVPDWPLGHRDFVWHSRRDQMHRVRVAAMKRDWLNIRAKYRETSPEGWAQMRFSTMEGLLRSGYLSGARESRSWSGLAPEERKVLRLMVSDILASGLVFPWLPFLPRESRRELATRYSHAF